MSKSQQTWEVEERKLQSVYDDISSHRLSSAQSTLTRYLKKSPKSQPALILKMYIQQKNGVSEDDLLGLYEQIKGLGEMSGRGVWWVGLIFRNMARTDLALQLYNELSSKHPDSPQLLEQVFLHAAADNNTDILVKSSRKIFNLTREERWARLSAWSEWVKIAPQPTPSQPFPPLCPDPTSLKIALLLLNTSKSPSTSEGLWLKSQILLSAGQLEEALGFLQDQGQEGGLVRLWWRMEGVREGLKRLKEAGKDTIQYWQKEREWVGGLLKADKDSQRNYSYYRHLLVSTEHLLSNEAQIMSTDDLLQNLEEEIGAKERSPSLARLELQKTLRKNQSQSDRVWDNEKWLKAVERYWIHWGSKGSIISELEGIVDKNDEERKGLVEQLLEKQASQQQSDEQSFREQVNSRIYLLRQKPKEWKPTLKEIKKYWDLYLSGTQYGKHLPKTDVRPADHIGLVTVSLLIELWSVDKVRVELLFKAKLCLERILGDSPACAHGKYLLIRLYRLIGAPSLTATHLNSLKLSEIQLDNLLHIYTERGACESLLGANEGLWNDHMKKSGDMYQRTLVDFPEYIKECLSNETYSKIPSIQYISSSLSKSITNHSRTIEQARLATYLSAPYGPKLLKKLDLAADQDEVVDLRNWELISEIGGNRPLIKDLTSLGEPVEGKWVKVFGSIYRDLARFSNGEEVERREVLVEGLTTSEASLVKNAQKILDLAGKALRSSYEIPKSEVESIFEESIQLSLSAESRWEQIQALICLYELIKVFDVILNKLIEINKPLKGKKKIPVLVQFINDMKNVKEKLQKEGLKDVFGKIDEMSIENTLWEDVNDGWIEDKEFVGNCSGSIDKSRRDALGKMKDLLSGK
ncbi:hypothetical protein V865_001280 [Kwoniella europaea PYCC6329]|uniref:Uncharacterized protein n=1 Tax=Kwoniella europaea PYCC6329 TaxID=1423913 RepID=A0AAX4KB82_9TREE